MDNFTDEEEALVRKYIEREMHYLSITKTLEVCSDCKGLGFTSREELIDYHRGEYDTFHDSCKTCDGDGRVVAIETKIEIKPYYNKTIVPFTKFDKDPYDSKNREHKYFKLTIDERNHTLERDNPQLKAITYDVYNKMAKKLKMIEKLKK